MGKKKKLKLAKQDEQEIKIGISIIFGGIILEVILSIWLTIPPYIGLGLAILFYVIFTGFRYVKMREALDNLKKHVNDLYNGSFKKLEDDFTIIKNHYDLLTAPKGYIEYLKDVYKSIQDKNGYPLHTRHYTEMLAKFLAEAKQSFISTWTIEVDLKHMSPEYTEQQKKKLQTKKRLLFLSEDVLKAQLQNSQKIREFIKWHKANGIELHWLDRETFTKDIMQQGLTDPQITEVLKQCEDFIVLDNDVVLFYDTQDAIKEGNAPNRSEFYSVSLINMKDLKKSQTLFHKRLTKIVEKICGPLNTIKIKSLNDLKHAIMP